MRFMLVLFLFGILLAAGCSQQGGTTGGTVAPAPSSAPSGQPNPVPGETPSATPTPTPTPQPAPPSANGEVKEFKAVVQHTSYSPAKFTVNKGDTVRILATTPKGQEVHKHGFTIDEYGINTAVQSSDESNPVKIEFVADKTGSFKIYCKTCNDDDGFKGKFGSTHPVIQATLEVQ